MSASTDVQYFLGQGKVYLAPRIAGGAVKGGYRYVGDCDLLQLSTNQRFDDIEESYSGNRLVAAHIPVGTSYAFKMNAKQWSIDNLMRAAYGQNNGSPFANAITAGGSVSNEGGFGYNGARMPLAYPQVSAVSLVLGGAATTLASVSVTAAGTGGAPGAYLDVTFTGATATVMPTAKAKINAAGGIDYIDVLTHGTNVTVMPTGITVTGVTGNTHTFNAGQTALVLDTDYTVDATNGTIEFLTGSTRVPKSAEGIPIESDYTYESLNGIVEAVTSGIQEFSCRFEGMNTANDRSPVIVMAHRVSMNLAKMLDLIQNKHGNLEMDGMLLPDLTRDGITQSQFYSIIKV